MRNALLIAALVVLLAVGGWLAVSHPNKALANCQFDWFGPAGFWYCPSQGK